MYGDWPLSDRDVVDRVAKAVRTLNRRADFWFGSARRKRDAVYQLTDLADRYDHAMAAIVAAGGLTALVRLLRHRNGGVRKEAAGGLGSLAADSEPNKADIVAAGAVPALLQLLRPNSDGQVSCAAVETLCSLAAGGGPVKAALMAAGAVPALVPLLSQVDAAMYPAAALHHLAKASEANRAAILAAGATRLLVPLLEPHILDGVQWAAADVLLSLAGGSSGVPAPKLLHPVAAASAVPALVRLLGGKDASYSLQAIAASAVPRYHSEQYELMDPFVTSDAIVRKAAAAVLLNLARSSKAGVAASPVVHAGGSGVPTSTVTAGTVTALVQLLGARNSAVRYVTAVVLGDLARFSEPNRAAAVAAGAVPALEQLLRHRSSDSVHRAAARALASLAPNSWVSPSTEQAAPEQFQRLRMSSQATDIDTAQVRRPPAKSMAPSEPAAVPSAPPATASLLGSGPSAPPATMSLLAMLQPAAPTQSGTGPAEVTQADALKVAGASTISSVVATLGSFLGLGSQQSAPSPPPVGTPGDSGGVPPTPTRFAAGFKGRILHFSQLNLQRRLGSGSFGTVLLATLEETPVAAKVLVKLKDGPNGPEVADALTRRQLDQVQRECSLLASMSHPNIVQFLYACEWPPTLVTEYCARGSLLDVLQAARKSPQLAAQLSWARRLCMALDAARGILHMHNRGIAHRDLKSPNLLVCAGWQVKVADFGFSKVLDSGDRHGVMSSTMNNVNPKWQAPEVLRCEPATSPATFLASDAYAFGCIMWELMTWDVPWGGEPTYRVMYLKMNGGHLDIPSSPKSLAQLPGTDQDKAAFQRVAAHYTQLIKQCWADNHLERPKFASISQQLKEIQKELRVAA